MRVIVTGASKGIGRGIAAVLAEGGHPVGLLARSEDRLGELREQIEAAGGTAAVAAADLRRHDQTFEAIESLVEQLDGVDALVNNAGVVTRKPASEITLDEWHTMMETNINGVFYATRAVLPHLQRQGGGHVVNISSISGYMPLPGGSGYAASKHAVTGFSDSLLQEVRDHGIKVTTVFPGSVDSASHRDPEAETTWKLTPEEVGANVRHVLETGPNHLVSRMEIRPLSRPPKKG